MNALSPASIARGGRAPMWSAGDNPDTALLALRPEFERLRGEIDAENRRDREWTDEMEQSLSIPFDELCNRIADMPRAATPAGRALKAIAALYQLAYIDAHAEGGGALYACWTTLAGDVAGLYPLPGARS